MKTDNLIFDLDGVLLDSESNLDWLNRAISSALDELGVEKTEENRNKLYPNRIEEFENSVSDFPAPPKKVWRVREKYYLKEKTNMIEAKKLKPFPYIKEVSKLKGMYMLGIISNSPHEIVDKFIYTYQLEELFHAWVGRGSKLSDIKQIKPRPNLFLKLRPKMGSGDFIYVGDTEVDEQFANNTRMSFFYLTRNGKGFEDLRELANFFSDDTIIG